MKKLVNYDSNVLLMSIFSTEICIFGSSISSIACAEPHWQVRLHLTHEIVRAIVVDLHSYSLISSKCFSEKKKALTKLSWHLSAWVRDSKGWALATICDKFFFCTWTRMISVAFYRRQSLKSFFLFVWDLPIH